MVLKILICLYLNETRQVSFLTKWWSMYLLSCFYLLNFNTICNTAFLFHSLFLCDWISTQQYVHSTKHNTQTRILSLTEFIVPLSSSLGIHYRKPKRIAKKEGEKVKWGAKLSALSIEEDISSERWSRRGRPPSLPSANGGPLQILTHTPLVPARRIKIWKRWRSWPWPLMSRLTSSGVGYLHG